jgi:Outer membrane protein beta-barrel domain
LRKLALLVSACTLLLSADFSAAQQVDLMVSGSTLSAFPSKNASVTAPPVEKNGIYVGISGDYVGFTKHRLGISVESAWRYHQAFYPYNGESYRPIFTDANALFQPRLTKKFGLDIMAGIGIATTEFNVPAVSQCGIAGGGCINYTSSNHFMEDIGGGLRYRFWRRLFVRPEGHYYRIQNNLGFNSDNVYRIGVSVGYSFTNK